MTDEAYAARSSVHVYLCTYIFWSARVQTIPLGAMEGSLRNGYVIVFRVVILTMRN